jgi:hypothetical protein
MSFGDPVVAGTTLIRAAIRSPDYIPGVSGWTINRDGTAEFNDVTVRGELIVTDPDGSYVRIFDENPGSGALIQLNPADVPGHTVDPATIIALSSESAPPPEFVILQISGPDIDSSASNPYINWVTDTTGVGYLEFRGDYSDFSNRVVIGEGLAGGPATLDMLSSAENPLILIAGAETGFEIEAANQLAGGTGGAVLTGTSFVAIPSAPTGTLIKRHPNTRVDLAISATVYADTVNCVGEIGIRLTDSGATSTDVALCRMPIPQTNTRIPFVGFDIVSGLPADSYTVTPIWRRVSGAGGIGRFSGAEPCSWRAAEVLE